MVRIHFTRIGHGGAKADSKLAPRIPEIRKLLRTDMSIAEIAVELGTCPESLRNLIRRRRLCDIGERRKFISRQKSLAKLDAEEDAEVSA